MVARDLLACIAALGEVLDKRLAVRRDRDCVLDPRDRLTDLPGSALRGSPDHRLCLDLDLPGRVE